MCDRGAFNGIELGDKVKDTLTGFEGVATALTKTWAGAESVEVTPDRLSSDGKIIAGEWIAASRLAWLKQWRKPDDQQPGLYI